MRFLPAMFALVLAAAPALAQEAVEIPGDDGKPLRALMVKPDGPGPFPAIVALHGCGGIGQKGKLGQLHSNWASKLKEQGFLVLFPDSYGSRGLEAQCLVRDRTVRPSRERVADVLAARAFLQARSDVKADNISLLGWSNGATSVIWSVAANRKPRDGRPDFRAAVALYPGCRLPGQAAERRDWENRMRLLILIGEADTWTPTAPCRDLVAAANKAGGSATIITYPGAAHVFDHPDLKMTKRTGLAFTGDDSGEAMVGTDPTARDDVLKRVPEFFKS